ncbi:purine nucleosidase [Actinomadura pelletieri DSM 43383]|uniref:Purine nucleosidase n=1 Tax=Actinomadura pelletieri DSM 43383 TaxID=1120940 RepID=A0A495QX50_9ACTN|nr:nucleoside hydrolase [Actinomadura pelletieri]RKS78769.1 purine nucleosidase [Actinomadura pelletieri DSM 43383]
MTLVYLDHDGGLDDLAALCLLLSYDHVNLIGVAVTPADCLLEPALSVTAKMSRLAGRNDLRPAPGIIEGRNPFPMAWRVDCLRVDQLPILNTRPAPARGGRPSLPAHKDLVRKVLAASEPVTVVCTGPLTNLARGLDEHPEIEGGIREVVIMGGAIDVDGNVDRPGYDGSAEWNLFWDPEAAGRVWRSGLPLTLYPLDATDHVPVTSELVADLTRAAGSSGAATLVATLWAMTFGTWECTGLPYCCWDTLTASHLGGAEICRFETITTSIVTGGPSQGRVVRGDGRPVKVAVTADSEAFARHVIATLANAGERPPPIRDDPTP